MAKSFNEVSNIDGADHLIIYYYLVQCMKELAKPEPDIESLLP
ncbi:hypothetical protein [Vibrio lentus]|nr:hypothetical protein [Vibrio lentus]